MSYKWALVTGGSSGIGLCIARELGRKGYALALVSNQESELESCASELCESLGVATAWLYYDLCRPNAPTEIWDWVPTARRATGFLLFILYANQRGNLFSILGLLFVVVF